MKKFCWLFLILASMQSELIAQNAWKSPEYKPEPYRKTLVLLKTTDALAKREMEDATVKLLADKSVTAIASYTTNITDADLTSEESFLKKADELEIDALLVYTVKGTDENYKNTASVNMSLGVPIRLGIFGGFLGTNVPIAGGTKTVTVVHVTASFYNRSSTSMLWSLPLSGKLKRGTSKLTMSFAKTTVSAITKDELFLK